LGKQDKTRWLTAQKTSGVIAAALAVTPLVGNSAALADPFFDSQGTVVIAADQGNLLHLEFLLDSYFYSNYSILSYAMLTNSVTGSTYTITGDNPLFSMSGPIVSLTDGLQSFSIQATDMHGSTTGVFSVKPVAPPAAKPVSTALTHVRPNSYQSIPLTSLFDDPDNNMLSAEGSFTGTTYSSDFAYITGYGSDLSLMMQVGETPGTRTVTVNAWDADYDSSTMPNHLATNTFTVAVENQAPVPGAMYNTYQKDMNLVEGGPVVDIPINGLFTDPDNDPMYYSLDYGDSVVHIPYCSCSSSIPIYPENSGTTAVTITATDSYGAQNHLTFTVNVMKQVKFGYFNEDYVMPLFFNSADSSSPIPVNSTRPGTVYLAPVGITNPTKEQLDSLVNTNSAKSYELEPDAEAMHNNNATISAFGLPEGKYRLYLVYDPGIYAPLVSSVVSNFEVLASTQTVLVFNSTQLSSDLAGAQGPVDIGKIVSYMNSSQSILKSDRDYVQALLQFIPAKFIAELPPL
jgi:hypothetical protein